MRTNALGQPIGDPVPGWSPPPLPSDDPMEGRYARVERLDAPRHASELFEANALDCDGRNWTYLSPEPFTSLDAYAAWVGDISRGRDPLFHAIVDRATNRSAGIASYMRISPEAGSIEVGHINFSPLLQGTRAATDAMYLMMRRAFALGYRRYEWKCDALNAPSRRAAQRLGLSFEGIFRQALVYKGRNRDTAWYAAIDAEWPALEAAFETWLAPSNFDAAGRQRISLRQLTGPVLKAKG